jgi:hypothetical protein
MIIMFTLDSPTIAIITTTACLYREASSTHTNTFAYVAASGLTIYRRVNVDYIVG